MVALQEEYLGGHLAGLDMETGDPIDPADSGIWDNFRVKRQLLNSWYVSNDAVCAQRSSWHDFDSADGYEQR